MFFKLIPTSTRNVGQCHSGILLSDEIWRVPLLRGVMIVRISELSGRPRGIFWNYKFMVVTFFISDFIIQI